MYGNAFRGLYELFVGLLITCVIAVPLGLWKICDLVWPDTVVEMDMTSAECIEKFENEMNARWGKGYNFKVFRCDDIIEIGPPPEPRGRTEQETIDSWNRFVENRKVDFTGYRNRESYRIQKQ